LNSPFTKADVEACARALVGGGYPSSRQLSQARIVLDTFCKRHGLRVETTNARQKNQRRVVGKWLEDDSD
jgi:hypothetical protein